MVFIRKTGLAIYLFCGVILTLAGVNGWRPYKIVISNHTVEVFSPKCRANATFADSGIFDLHIEFLKNIRHPSIRSGLYFESDDGIYDMEVLNRTIDVCKFFKNKRDEPILQVVYKLFADYLTHWLRSCPINKGVYYVKNVELNVEKLPPFFPEKSGMYDTVISDKQERLVRINAFFQITKTFKKNKAILFLEWMCNSKDFYFMMIVYKANTKFRLLCL